MHEGTSVGGTTGLSADAAHRLRLMQAGQMLAGLVHEINNPLAVILGYAQLLHDRAACEDDRRDLRIVLDEARRAASLVDDMLGFTRRATDVECADLQRVVQAAVNLTAHEVRQARITLVASLPQHAVPVRAPHGVCLQVLLNVLANARQSLEGVEPERRAISLRLEQPAPPANEGEAAVVSLLVSNTGPPIEPELAEAIFEPFFTTKPEGEGSGLGLALCRELLARHEASIALEPGAQGDPVCFRITLPAG
jgi:two-component system NtrC family sensor kinase